MKTLNKIKAIIIIIGFAMMAQSCHLGLSLGVGANDKNSPGKNTELQDTPKDTAKAVVGPKY